MGFLTFVLGISIGGVLYAIFVCNCDDDDS